MADFDESERVAYADMPELERYALHRLAELDGKLKSAVNDFAFSRYMRMLTDFAQDDLSAFFFDIRKDRLYCDVGPNMPQGTLERRAYRTVLDTLFHALVRYIAPVLCFTAEEVWQTRFADESDSVHLKEWPDLVALLNGNHSSRHSGEGRNLSTGHGFSTDASIDPGLRRGDEFVERWVRVREIRELITGALERHRREKLIGSSLEGYVKLGFTNSTDLELLEKMNFEEICIAGGIDAELVKDATASLISEILGSGKVDHDKCGRCWRHLPEVSEDGALCGRCKEMVA